MGIFHTRHCRGANWHDTKSGPSTVYTPGWQVERKPARPRIESEDPRREQEMSLALARVQYQDSRLDYWWIGV